MPITSAPRCPRSGSKKPGKPSLSNGSINVKEIAGLKIYIFVSHAHSDHYDPGILDWKKSLDTVIYIFGWKTTDDSTHICFGDKREIKKVNRLEIANIHHRFDGIPESAFLVKVDGLVIFFAGDHGHSQGRKNEEFKSNIEYMAGLSRGIDLVFTPTFGGEFDTIEILSPKVVIPMHDGGHEHQYRKFADKVKRRGIKVKVGVAQKRGDCFLYKKGKIKSIK